MNRELGNCRSTKTTVAVTTTALLVLLLGDTVGAFAQSTFAQSSRAPRSERQSSELRLQAPIGARQPRPQDLPAQVLREEGRATASQRKFDKSLEICRDCGIQP
jgi:hypothetical protein